MADFFDPYSKPRMKVSKGTAWGNWNLPDGMTDSEAVNRRERFRKNRRIKSQHLEQKSRLPFEEMFLFGSHPENDILSISQCPGCGRRYKTQWLHNFHWEANSAGDFVCACSKKIVIPHRSSSKSDHHKHHHQDSSKMMDGVHHSSYSHSKQSNRSSSPKLHQSSKSSLAKLDSKSSKQLKKPALITKAKAKMMPPPVAAPPISSNKSANLSSKSRTKTPAASYTLSIPSEDTGQNESVESLLQSNKSYSNGSNYGNKPIHMIATAVQKASKVALEGEYEQMKFYSDTSYDKKNKSSSGHSHSHGVGHSSHGHSSGHSHSHSHSHGHSHSHSHGHGHSHSHKSSSNDNDKHATTSEGVTLMSGDSSSAHKSSSSSKNALSSASGPTLQNFKIPLKSKSHVASTLPPSASVPSVNSSRSNSSHTSLSHSSKHKSKQPPSTPKPSHPDNHHSSPRSTPPATSSNSPSPGSHHSHHSSSTHHNSSGQLAHAGGSSQSSHSAQRSSGNVAPPYKSPVHPPVVESPVMVEIKNEELSPPPKKKKKKKSKDEPRKILPLKDRLFDPDIHCGVSNGDSGIPCTRSLTCKTHSMALRRAVPGRSQNFDQLLAEHKKARDAEKAAKAAFEHQQSETSVNSPSPIAVTNSPGTAKQSSKVKSKNTYTVSIPSPLSSLSLSSPNTSSRSAPSPGSATNFANVSSVSAQTKVQSYSSQTMQSSSTTLYVPKVEILLDKSSFNQSSIESPSTASSKNSGENVRSPPVSRDSKILYEVDELTPSTLGCKFPVTTIQSPATKTPDYAYNVEIPVEVQTESYISSNMGKQSEGRAISESLATIQDSYQPEEMEIQDPLSAALEMAASAAAMGSGSIIPDISHGFSTQSGLMSGGNIDHGSLIGLPASVSQHLFPAAASSVYSSPSAGFGSGFTLRNPVHAITSSVFTPAVSQNYLSASTYSSSYAAAGTDFPTESFHTDATDYQKEAVYQAAAGFQASNFSSTFNSYSSNAALYQSAPLARYPIASVYPKTPSVFPTTSVYPTAAYATPSPAVYPPAPLYQAGASSLFPSEPPLFSIIDDLFSETPTPSISSNGTYAEAPNIEPPSGNSSSFHQQPFPSVSRIPASTPGMPPSMAPSMDMNTNLGRQWGSSSTGTHYSPFSGGTGSSVLVTHLDGDIDNLEIVGGCSNTGTSSAPTKFEILNRKKLLLAKEKLNQCENNPGDYLTLLADGESIERGFMVIQSRKHSDENTCELNGENVKKSEKADGKESKEKMASVLKQKRVWKKLKQPVYSTIVPFESKRAFEDTSSKKAKSKKNLKKSKPKLTSVPYVIVPDPSISEAIANRIAEGSEEAVRALQTSAKALAAFAGTVKGSNKRKLPIVDMELQKNSKKHCIYKILSDLNKDFDVDLFNGMKGLRTKSFLRLIKFDSSLHDDKKERRHNLHTNRLKEVSINFQPKDGENATVSDEIEIHIDTLPALEVDPPN
ncbi:unnamed protein product [Allacma fusca]|uniref:SCA7 domain-containing protein n=1 Tax=Allacma fusca TaxID=39272 RepID=A0A8J2JJE8_9HEXA|nr:unnamed protein product [Allacma fusca]